MCDNVIFILCRSCRDFTDSNIINIIINLTGWIVVTQAESVGADESTVRAGTVVAVLLEAVPVG